MKYQWLVFLSIKIVLNLKVLDPFFELLPNWKLFNYSFFDDFMYNIINFIVKYTDFTYGQFLRQVKLLSTSLIILLFELIFLLNFWFPSTSVSCLNLLYVNDHLCWTIYKIFRYLDIVNPNKKEGLFLDFRTYIVSYKINSHDTNL